MCDTICKKHRLHGGIFNQTLRDWNSLNAEVTCKNLMYPLFIIENDDEIQEIPSMPGISRYGINHLKKHLDLPVKWGLKSVLLFGVTETLTKDEVATNANSKDNPVIKAIPKIKSWFPNLTIACDVCLCAYTLHGHCGILNSDGSIDNSASLKRIAEVALSYAQAGAHIVAPSDMMDGRIAAIKDILIKNKLENKVAVLSYAAKFASVFYGPFRDAAKSAPSFGDRKCYQLPAGSSGLAVRAADRDVEEGADMLMVKPGLAYLDILRQVKDAHPEYPLFVYQVSGEYAMIYHAAKAGAFDLQNSLNEILISMRRAGADVIITYFTPLILEWLETQK
ncbi:delta-aminolevulinic acid dehydratase isoform X1 [Agrilus planipennis]|uniref:Delta-aminolevulinic acid dehydratase n=2 Tax=Agrilus planipennis TaxID=224129 RepID=A0A1W4WIU1_AGRPL|nr:delta-aminolevulinic acid dehydratase isoform X1 [Agrilus planipennis]